MNYERFVDGSELGRVEGCMNIRYSLYICIYIYIYINI